MDAGVRIRDTGVETGLCILDIFGWNGMLSQVGRSLSEAFVCGVSGLRPFRVVTHIGPI